VIPGRMRLVNVDTELSLDYEDSDRTILRNTSEITFPDPRAVTYDRIGRSGKKDLTRLHDVAQFTASLYVVDNETIPRHTTLETIHSMLHPRNRPYVYVYREGWAAERRAELRGSSVSCTIGPVSGSYLEVRIQAVIPEGVLESGTANTREFSIESATVGTEVPMLVPSVMMGASLGNQQEINVDGNTITPPKFLIYGGCDDPSFTVQYEDESQKTLAFTGLTINPGDYLEVDIANRTAYINSEPANSYYHKLNFTVSEWWELEPGANQITFNATNTDSSCVAYVEYRDRWLGG
jgi:hypothetical protein